MLAFRQRSRRSLALGLRDTYGLNALHRLQLKIGCENIDALTDLYAVLKGNDSLQDFAAEVAAELVSEYDKILRILVVEAPEPVVRIQFPRWTFFSMETELQRLGIDCSARFRFQSFEQLRRLAVGFRFPTGQIILKYGYRATAEEIILVSLTRLSFPCRWEDMYERFPGRKSQALQVMFYFFLNFMVKNWAYLLLNNMTFWLPYLPTSCEAIRLKLANLGNVDWRLDIPQGVFQYCGFIDNTMIPFCRPGGVMDEGPQGDRVPEELQEAWYSGWKKLHGMKWETVILANGMDLHVFGPESVRHNDLFMLDHSGIEQKMRDLQAGRLFFYRVFGDSAYVNSDVLGSGGGRGMASVRETVEWSYKDLKVLWKYCDYRHVLKVRKQPVAKIIFVCMLLRNAHVTMCGAQGGEYLDMLPPTFEDWVSQGPSAHPIPISSIFHPDFVHDENDNESSDEEEA